MKKKTHKGNITRPRLVVSKTNKHFYVQVIDDTKMHTIVSSSTVQLKLAHKNKTSITLIAKDICEKMNQNKITQIIFDRNGNRYLSGKDNKVHGNIALLASIIRASNIQI